MKSKLLIIALSFALSSLVMAGSGGKHRVEHKQEMMNELNLTDDQRQKFDAVMEAKHKSMKTAKKKLHEDTRAQLAEFLNADQMEALDQHRGKHKKKHKKKHKNR